MTRAILFLAFRAACNPPTQPPVPPADPARREVAGSTAEILATSDLTPLVPAPLDGDPMQTTLHRLKNGMTVYISTDRQKPRFFGWIAVRAGSRHDPADSTGLAHYLEHMILFKGSDDLGTVDFAKERAHVERVRELYAELRAAPARRRTAIMRSIDAETQAMAQYSIPGEPSRLSAVLGITEVNAFTNKERTYYITNVPSNRTQAWATMQAEKFADPVFRLFYPELEAVYEEKNRGLDDPSRRVWVAMSAAMYPKHPYGSQTTLGEVEHLKLPAYQDMVDFYGRWYVPNNMAILLAGDVDSSILPVLEETFGKLEPKRLEAPPKGDLTPIRGRVTAEVLAEAPQLLRIAWRTVPIEHADEPALAVLEQLLDDERVGLLNTELEQPKRVQWAWSSRSHMSEAGSIILEAGAHKDQAVDELEPLLLAVVAKIKAGDFTDEDVAAVKLQAEIGRKIQLEFPVTRVRRMLDAFVQHREWANVVERERRFDAVTREDVIRVANKYLGDNKVVVTRRKGKNEVAKIPKPHITPLSIDAGRKSAFATRIEAMPAQKLEPTWLATDRDYTVRDVAAGRLIASPNPHNDLFYLGYRFDRGLRKAKLLCFALELFEASGTSDKSATELQKQLYRLGSSIDTGCSTDRLWIHVSGIDANFEATLALMDAWFGDPSFDEPALEEHRRTVLGRRGEHLEREGSLTSALRGYAYYGKDSVWLVRPSNRALKRARPKALSRLVTSLFDYQHTMVYFGPRAAEAVATQAARGQRHRKVGPLHQRRYRKLAKTRIFFVHREQAKAAVNVIFAGPALAPEHKPAATLLARYLGGGSSGQVFRQIRDARGLAYASGGGFDFGDRGDQASVWGFMQNQPDKVAEALPVMLEVLSDTSLERTPFAEIKVAVDQRVRAARIEPRRVAVSIAAWWDEGEVGDPRKERWEAMQKLEASAVEALVQRYTAAPAIISIVGDRERVDLEALSAIADVEDVDPKTLVSY